MPITVEVKGETIEFPDGTPDEVIDRVVRRDFFATPPTPAVPPPAPSVAASARSRLEARGLTPESVKAGYGGSTPGDFKYVPRTSDSGFWGELGHALNPVTWLGGAMTSGANLVTKSFLAPYLQSDDQAANEEVARTLGLDTPDLRLSDMGVPDYSAIYNEASRRGEQGESLAGMYGSATGQAALTGAALGTSAYLKGRAPARMAAAEADYARATGTTATPAMTEKMMRRGIRVGADPSVQGAAAENAAAEATAQRASVPSPKPTRGASGKFEVSTDPVDMTNAMRRADLAREARFQRDLQVVMDGIPETRTVLEAAQHATGRAAYRGGIGGLGLTSLGVPRGVATTAALMYVVYEFADQIRKTNAWRTTSPLLRQRFNAALVVNDPSLAMSTAALIATSQSSQTGNNNLPDDSPIYPQRREGEHVEWPSRGQFDENDAMLMRRTDPKTKKPLQFPVPVPPSQLLPEKFKNARKVLWGAPYRRNIGGVSELRGGFGEEFDPAKRVSQVNPANTIQITADSASVPGTYAHEIGHSIYEFDLPRGGEDRALWNGLVDRVVAAWQSEGQAALAAVADRPAAERKAVIDAVSAKFPRSIVQNFVAYRQEQNRVYHEAFAEAFGQFMLNPTIFKRTYPDVYQTMKQIIGTEYIGGKSSMK